MFLFVFDCSVFNNLFTDRMPKKFPFDFAGADPAPTKKRCVSPLCIVTVDSIRKPRYNLCSDTRLSLNRAETEDENVSVPNLESKAPASPAAQANKTTIVSFTIDKIGVFAL